MVSRKNVQFKRQQDAKQVPHYGLRKLSVGVASVLLGTVVYMQNGSTVHADVNPTVSAGNDSAKVADENVGVGYSAGTLTGINSTDSASSVVVADGATDSMVSSQAAGSPAENATGQGNNSAATVGEFENGASAGQAMSGVNQVVASDNIKSVAGSAAVPNRPTSVAVGNSTKGRSFANLSVKPSFLAVSKVASTGTSNNGVNGGFDKATWGTLDVNAWQGHVQGDYYQLTDYTGDANHVIVPNAADFAKAGISTGGKQVGVTSDLMHRIFTSYETTAHDATVAFSKTDNKQVKAINANWYDTWNSLNNNRGAKLSRFDGTNLDVSNVTNMSGMFAQNQISDLSPLANWKVDNVTNMNAMFAQNQISDLSPLANWKVDNVTNMNAMFARNQISDLSPLINWNVNNVTNMSGMFGGNQISNLSPLANWNVNNVTDMGGMFWGNQISNLSPLTSWKVDNVTDMSEMFEQNQISDLSPLSNWNVNNVTDMSEMLEQNQISDLSPLTNWNVNNVAVMYAMFAGNQISDLSPLANWKVNNVTYMAMMFSGNQISNLSPLASWKVDNVTDMSGMFSDNHISDLSPLASWKVDNVTDMYVMFQGNQISNLSPLANWHVDNVTDMGGMFRGNQISDLSPLANWKVDNVTSMSGMFDDNISSIPTKTVQAKRIINFVYPVGYTGKKQDPVTQTIDVPTEKVKVELTTKESDPSNNILDWVTKTETPISTPIDPVYFQDYTVPAIKGLLEPDKMVIAGQQADITKPINVTVTYKLVESNTNDAFALDSKNGLHEHANVNDNGGYDTDFWGKINVDDWNYTVNGDRIEISGLKDGVSTGANDAVIVPNLDDFKLAGKDGGAKTVYISKAALRETAAHKYYGLSKTNGNTFATDNDLNSTFKDNNNLTHVDLDSLNTGNVTDMRDMFNKAKCLVSLDVSNWATGNVTDMGYMFSNTDSLTSLDVSNWDTGKVTDMEYMLKSASSLTSLDVSNWDTSNVTNMRMMFHYASSLRSLDVSNWDTGNVTDMSAMFDNTRSLTSLDVSNWDTGKVTDMNAMFSGDNSLTSLDVSNWDTGNVTNMRYMFSYASSLTSLNVSNWNLTKLTNKDSMQYMFAEDPNLTVIANNLELPAWYQNEINDADYFWNNHMAVITNVPELIKSTGAIDNLKIDDQDVSRSIFYDSKGSSDVIQVLKDANQAYAKQYQNEHPGYILTLAADVDQSDPIALANAKFVSAPLDVQFRLAYNDLTGKLVNATTSTHKVGETVSVSPVAPTNYVLVNGQLRTNYLMCWGLNEADFLVEPKLTQTTETKTVSRTIKVQMPDGQTKNVVQTVKFVRNGYLNQVTKQTTYLPWSFGGQYQFSSYQPKPIDGYTVDVAPAVIVTPDSSDTMISLTYHKQAAVYSVDYQLANGTVVKNVSVTPESNGMIHLAAPQGYRLLTPVTDMQVGHSSQTLAVLVVPDEHTYTAKDTLPSGVKEPLTKTVTRKVVITMPNGHVRTVKQAVKFERTVTVDSAGHVTYGNWQAVGRAQFNKVFVPKRHGYHLVITDASGKALTDVVKIDNVTAEMNDAVVSVKYVKD